MKRFYLATVGVAFVAMLVATTVGFAQPAKSAKPTGPSARRRSCRRCPRTSSRATA